MSLLFQLNQALYWLGLSSWFGAVVFIAIAAPVIFKVVRENDPTLPGVLSVNLDAQHSTLLAGTIVARIMGVLSRVALGGAIAVLIGIIGQAVITRPSGQALTQLFIRAAVFVGAVAVLIYDWRSVSPRLFAARQEYIDQADNPDVANAAQDRFEKLSAESINALFFQTLLLLGLILFSGYIPNVTTAFSE